MKILLLLLPLLTVVQAFTDMNDSFLEDTMLSDKDKALKETQDFATCLLDEKPCEGFNAIAKTHVVASLADGCAQCDLVQKRGAIKFLKSLKNDFPELWTKFEKKYDPDRTKYENIVKMLDVYDS